ATRKAKLFYQDYVAYHFYDKCRIRPDDVIIGSYQKSGRTWVRFFFGSYICHLYDLGYEVDWHNFTRLTPDRYCSQKELLGFPESVPHRVIFSHDKPIGRYFPDRDVIYITRKFTDILVSYYYFHKNRNRPQYAEYSLDEFALNKFHLKQAVLKLNYFSRQLEQARNLTIISYESLTSDPDKRFREMIEFSKHRFDADAFAKALERSSFESMRRLEEEQRGRDDEEGYHTRKGKSGEAKKELDADVSSAVNEFLKQNLSGILKPYYLGEKQ
ncbi:MAG TPA: sulfotransferase domain-containing protein, partial [Balneolaceae bacterium]|nr:sulfotransferase domain-containing protein [Balneolaceae bacterium]